MATTKTKAKTKKVFIPQVEEAFKKLPVLRFEKFFKKELNGVNLEEFVNRFYNQFNDKHNTKDVKTDRIENTIGKYRSLQDLYSISKYYYPNMTIEEFFTAVFENCKKNRIFGRWFCNSTKRYVLSKEATDYDEYTVRDEELFTDSDVCMSNIYEELGYSESDFENESYDEDAD